MQVQIQIKHLLKLQGRKQVGRTQVDDGSSAFGSLNAFTIIVYHICFLNIIDGMNTGRDNKILYLLYCLRYFDFGMLRIFAPKALCFMVML